MEGERLYLVFTSEFEPPGSPEEGFGGSSKLPVYS
jgi:hypothetical protein